MAFGVPCDCGLFTLKASSLAIILFYGPAEHERHNKLHVFSLYQTYYTNHFAVLTEKNEEVTAYPCIEC